MRLVAIFGSAFIILWASCAPRPIFRLQPQEEQTTFNQGIEYIQVEQNGVILTMSYYRHLSDRFVMDVEIVNETDSLLRVDPTHFSYDALKNQADDEPIDKDTPIFASQRALNPEQELLKTDMAISRKKADQRTSVLFHSIGQVASVASSIASDDLREQERLRQERMENRIYHEIREEELELEEANLRDQRAVWEIEALRKTDLWPGEYIRGYVFFINAPDAEMYHIRFDNEQASFRLTYLQWKYENDKVPMD